MKPVKVIAERLLGIFNYFPTRSTEREAVLSLVRSLWPVRSPQELIRLGPPGDGGYLIPDDLAGVEACFSPGVSVISGFEASVAELGIPVFLADGSVAGPSQQHDLFRFSHKFVGAIDDDDFMTLDGWVSSCLPASEGDLVLQMDIEGYEYETIFRVSDALMRRFRVMVIEFHRLDQLWNQAFFALASRVFAKVLTTHTCVHIHPNNCFPASKKAGLLIPPLMEFTFQRRDRLAGNEWGREYPHPLDCDNTDCTHLPLPRCWYAGA